LTIQSTDSITETSTRTPTAVASADPEQRPNELIAVANASATVASQGGRRQPSFRWTVLRLSHRRGSRIRQWLAVL